MRGQLDISFQWIYVVIAGGAFLLLFFIIFRAYTHNAQQSEDLLGARAAATSLTSAAWQPDSAQNMSIKADVVCKGGVLALQQGSASATMPGAPVFLPPKLSGKAIVVSREFARGSDGVPAITYGNLLYVLDENTYYVLLGSAGSISVPAARQGSVITTDADRLKDAEIPEGAVSVVIVTQDDDLARVALPKADAAVYGVAVKSGKASFYVRAKRTDAALTFVKDMTYVGDELRLGAIISATPQTYNCSKAGFVQRSRDIVAVYDERLRLLRAEALPQACIDEYAVVAGILRPGLADDALLASFSDQRITAAQQMLYGQDCPVIA